MSGQIPGGPEISRVQSDGELYSQVNAGAPFGDTLEQAEDPLADARDSELLGPHNRALTEEESADMEAVALRRLERRKKRMTKLEPLVGSGPLPFDALDVSSGGSRFCSKGLRIGGVANRARPSSARVDGAPRLRVAGSSIDWAACNGTLRRRWLVYLWRLEAVSAGLWKAVQKVFACQRTCETAVHRALGYDHQGRLDVALFPDALEGLCLRDYLESYEIPARSVRLCREKRLAPIATAAPPTVTCGQSMDMIGNAPGSGCLSYELSSHRIENHV